MNESQDNSMIESLKLYESILEALPTPVSVMATDKRVLFINKAAAEAHGLDPAGVKGRPCCEVWDSPICSTPRCGIDSLENGNSRIFWQENGRHYTIEVCRLFNAENEHIGYMETTQDITQYLNLFNGIDAHMIVTDIEDDSIFLLTDQTRKLHKLTDNCIEDKCYKALYGLDERCEECAKPVLKLGDPPMLGEREIVDENGKKRFFQTTNFFTEWKGGAVHVEHREDITRRRELELSLIEAKNRAERLSFAKSDFLSRMSHEMRTPMTAIIGMTDIARSSDDPKKIDYCLEKIGDASVHLLGVINDILDMSKIEAGKFELSDSDFALERMLDRVANVMNFRMSEKQQDFVIKVEPDVPPSIITDQQRLSQVLTNLLSNANKFTPEGGQITMNVSNLGVSDGLYTLLFEVRDTGIGIAPEQIPKVFDSFEQLDGSISRRFGGTGLGLSISKTIVELLDGSISVSSKLGEGSCFSFTIRAEKGISSSLTRLAPEIDLSSLRLLIVDDDATVRDYFLSIMGKVGLHCAAAKGRDEAIALMEKDEYHILFIDWLMPEMDGLKLTRELRRRYGERIIVIMISAYEWEKIRNDALEAGVSSFISKPLLPSPIIDCINECLGYHPGSRGEHSGTEQPLHWGLGKAILLAEDVEINREIIMAILEPSGLSIDIAENGAIALERVTEDPGKYDLILMDIQMPEMDGYEATRRIRALGDETQDVPIIAMTANVFREDIERCLEAGMTDHVGKPIDTADLISKIRRHIR